MPLVSVIIPVLNEERALPRCLDSVLSQTHAELEVLVVDNGSTDGSPDIARAVAAADKRVRVLAEAGGVSRARNRGLLEAKGEFVQFVDADDAVEPGMTAALVADITRSGADIATCAALTVLEADGREQSAAPSHQPLVTGLFSRREWFNQLAHKENLDHFGICCNKVFRLAVIKNAGIRFTPGFGFGEDHLFNLECLLAYSSLCIGSAPLYRYIESDAPGGLLTIRKFHPQAADFIPFYCCRLVREAARFCEPAAFRAIKDAAAGLTVMHVIRYCRRDSTVPRKETLTKLAEIAALPEVQSALAEYRPGPGHSRSVPFFLRRGWVRALFLAARRRADKRYGKYYAGREAILAR